MVTEAMNLMVSVVRYCVQWTEDLFAAVDGGGYVIAAFIVFLVVSLMLMPMRGGNVDISRSFTDYAVTRIHKGRYDSGKRSFGNKSRGFFSKGKSAQLIRQRHYRSL